MAAWEYGGMLMEVRITEIMRDSSGPGQEEPRWRVSYVRNERSNFLKVPGKNEDEARHVAALALQMSPSSP
jgi:hypothetical protein